MNLSLEIRKYLNRFYEILNQMSKQMINAPIVNNITKNFIEAMIPHHQAAIYMCENLLDFTAYEPLERIAKNIIKNQTIGIQQMKNILNSTKEYNSLPKEVRNYENTFFYITNNMLFRMKNSPRFNNVNLDFVYEMIPHHKGAIQMCNNLLKYNINPRLKEVANSIIQEQTRGVQELEQIKNILERR